ncbi:MAG: hypothetical protein HN368_05090 [Spirochaetales bacterium]|jgi:hypothetical protein|nr:hypothetical protein [Spirochaetales bacterium]
MRKVLLFALLLLFTAVLLPAQEMTWVNPDTTLYPYFPGSMPNYTTNGIYTDDLDRLPRAPAQLDPDGGYTFYTLFSNNETWNWTTFGTVNQIGDINGFYPNGTLTSDGGEGGGGDFGLVLMGALFPIFDFRGGVIGGFLFDQNGNIDGSNSTLESSTSVATDGDADNVRDDLTVTTVSYEDHTSETNATVTAGVDLGNIGAAFFGEFMTGARRSGGVRTYSYTYDPAEVTPAADLLTGSTIHFGGGEAGKTKGFPTASSTAIGGTGQLTLPLGNSLPIIASILVKTQTGPPSTANIPVMASASHLGPAGAAATDVASLNITRGLASGTSLYSTEATNLTGVFTGTLFNNVPVNENEPAALGTPATDLDNAKNSIFDVEISGHVDPAMRIGEFGQVRLRGGIIYGLKTENQTDATTQSMSYTGFNDISSNPVVYSYSETYSSPMTTITNTTGLEVGGIFDFASPNGMIEVAGGVIYNPVVEFSSSTTGPSVTTTTIKYTETGATEIADPADILGSGANIQGTQTTVVTAPESGQTRITDTTNTFYVPVATRVNLAEGKFQIINGYRLQFETTSSKTITPDALPATTVNTIFDSAGAAVTFTAPAATAASTEITSTTAFQNASSWSGEMNFMLRWLPFPELTLDFFGEMFLSALDMDLFYINFFDFITTIGFAATINIK